MLALAPTHGDITAACLNPADIAVLGDPSTLAPGRVPRSCTAGRSTFITGQACLRTGLSKVGAPGAPVGLQKGDITIAQAVKPLGYATGQFGKNHLGDTSDQYLPTNHGFDESPTATCII